MSIISPYQQPNTPYTTTNLLHSPAENSAREYENRENEQLPEHASKRDRRAEWAVANAYHKYCLNHYEPNEAAQRYADSYPDFARGDFYSTTSKRTALADEALAPSGWGTRLLAQLGYPNTPVYFYSLHMRHLELPVSYADPTFLYVPLVIQDIKAAIARLIPKPYYFKIEVGKNSGTHVHLIASAAPQLAHLIFEGSRVVEPLWSGRESGLFEYLAKPTAPFTAAHYGTYLQARANRQAEKEDGKLYRLSGQLGLKKRRKRNEL